MPSRKTSKGSKGSKAQGKGRSSHFSTRLPPQQLPASASAVPKLYNGVIGEGMIPMGLSGWQSYTYASPYANFVTTPFSGAFMFSFRHLPYDQCPQQDYYDWLMGVTSNLRIMIPELFKHNVDLQTDTIATLESFILAALARITTADVETIRRLSFGDLWRNAANYHAIMHPDLKPYVFRLVWTWPAGAKTRYTTVLAEDDREALEVMEKLRQRLAERALAELGTTTPDTPTPDDADRWVPAVQDSMLLAMLARFQYAQQVVVNVLYSDLSELVATLLKWRKGLQLMNPELVAYLRRFRFAGNTAKTFMPMTSTPYLPTLSTQRLVWLPSGELDYSVLLGTGAQRFWSATTYPKLVQLPQLVVDNAVTPLPRGTVITPATAAATQIMPAGAVYEPTYVSGSVATPGRPIIMPRPAFVSGDQAALLGGNQKRKPTSADVKFGGAARRMKKPAGTMMPGEHPQDIKFGGFGRRVTAKRGTKGPVDADHPQDIKFGGRAKKTKSKGARKGGRAADLDWKPARLFGFDDRSANDSWAPKSKVGGCSP